ncbi:transposase, partial [bacterium]|nr:transposase [bacterium]
RPARPARPARPPDRGAGRQRPGRRRVHRRADRAKVRSQAPIHRSSGAFPPGVAPPSLRGLPPIR